jgi:hypothetical protein
MLVLTAMHRKAGFYTKYESLNKSSVRILCQTSKNIFNFFLPLKQKASRNRGLYLPSNIGECAVSAATGPLNNVIPSDTQEQCKEDGTTQ